MANQRKKNKVNVGGFFDAQLKIEIEKTGTDSTGFIEAAIVYQLVKRGRLTATTLFDMANEGRIRAATLAQMIQEKMIAL